MRVVAGNGLPKIVAAGGRPPPRTTSATSSKIDDAQDAPLAHALAILLLLGSSPPSRHRAVFWLYGRERSTGYDREYEQEPPTDTEPALVPPLLRQGGEAGSYEFTATLFDLIRRGRYTSTPVDDRAEDLGRPAHRERRRPRAHAGRTDDRADRRGRSRSPTSSTPSSPTAGAAVRVPRARSRPTAPRTSKRFTAFKTSVVDDDRRTQLVRRCGGVLARRRRSSSSSASAALLFWSAIDGWRAVSPRWNDVVLRRARRSRLRERGALVLGALTQRAALAPADARRRRSRPSAGRPSAAT